MRMTIADFFEMIERKETPEQFEKRRKRIRRLANERDDLIDAIDVLGDDHPKTWKKRVRLEKVLKMIEELK